MKWSRCNWRYNQKTQYLAIRVASFTPGFYLLRLIFCILCIGAVQGHFLVGQNFLVNTKLIGEKDGLLGQRPVALHQDSEGFMWIATASGLNRYDGQTFKWFTKVNTQLSGATVRIDGINEDWEGYLWLTANAIKFEGSKIELIHHKTFEVISIEDKFNDRLPFNPNKINFIHQSDQNELLISHADGRCYLYSSESFFKEIKNLRSHNDIEVIGPEILWSEFEGSYFITNFSGERIDSFYLEGSGWQPVIDHLGSTFLFYKNDNTGTLKLAQKEIGKKYKILKSYQVPTSKNPRKQTSIRYHSIADVLVIGINGLDQFFISDLKTLSLTKYKSISRVDKFHLKDLKGVIWSRGMEGLELLEITKSPFKTYFTDLENPLQMRGIWANSNFLFGATQGTKVHLVNLKNGEFKELDRARGRNPFAVESYIKDELWTATPFQILRYDTSTFEVIDSIPFGSTDNVNNTWAILRDSDRKWWAAKYRGELWTSQKGRDDSLRLFEDYNDFKELRSSFIVHFSETEGHIFTSTNNGLFIIDKKIGVIGWYWNGADKTNYIPCNDIHYTYYDSDGLLWLATNRDGLVSVKFNEKWEVESFEKYTKKDQLSSDILYAIYEDDQDRLWVSSQNGFTVFNKNTKESRVYSHEDGLSWYEFNRISQFRDKQGKIYFGAVKGVTSFYPDKIQERDEYAVPILINNFSIYSHRSKQFENQLQSLVNKQEIVLKPSDRLFNLELGLADYANSDFVRFEYKIEGFIDEFQDVGGNNLQVSGLPYGKYKLHLRAYGPANQLSTHEIVYPVFMQRPYFLKWWFFGLIGLFSVVSFWSLVRYRLRRLKRRENELILLVQERTHQIKEDKRIIEKQAEKLKQLDKVKSQFFANISHEFRTPLTVISGMIDQIKKNPARWVDKGHVIIKRNSNSILNLVNQILDLQKLESGNIENKMIHGDIISFLLYTCDSFKLLARSKGVNCSVEYNREKLTMDHDPEKLNHVMSNLFSNAIKFTPSGGKVNLKITHYPELKTLSNGVDINSDDGVLFIEVKDTGIGISDKELPHIFDRFYQAASSSKFAKGTGIGLALSNDLINLLGGTITVNSKLNEWTTFRVELPVNHKEFQKGNIEQETSGRNHKSELNEEDISALAILEKASSIANGNNHHVDMKNDDRRPTILIVEDNVDVQSYLTGLLEDKYQISTSFNGKEGIEAAIEAVPDLIISDVMMPETDGFELCNTLKLDERTSHIPIILLTSRADAESRIKGLQQGADAYLEKPFHEEELNVRLQKLHEIRSVLRARYASLEIPVDNTPSVFSVEDSFLLKIRDYVLENIEDDNFGIQDLCSGVGMSRSQVHNKIKALTGISTSHFIRAIRLKKAKELLATTDLTISEIAYSVGFNNLSYFTRSFSKEYGITPRDSRK